MSSHAPAQPALVNPLIVLLSGNGGVAILTLARNLFAARLIGLENFGIAASFAILLSAVEMATALGAQQLIVQDPDGDSEQTLSSLHFVQLARGIFGATAIYVLADPIANFLGTPDVAWAYQTLSLVPLLSGFIHLDAWRYQRTHRFGPSVCIQLGPAILALLLVWPLYVKFGDFRILLVVAIAQVAGVLVMSRLVAERKYAISACTDRLLQVLRFGWPFALNGVLLAVVFHGEKILVGHMYGPEKLAILAIGFTLTLTPALVIGRSLQSYALPHLSKHQHNQTQFQGTAASTIRLCCAAGIALAVGLLLFAPLVPLVLGEAYRPVTALFPMLCAMHGLRVARTGISAVALAKKATGNAVIGNVPRVVAVPLLYHMLSMGASLPEILWVATAAEAIGFGLAALALRQTMRAHPC